MCFWASQVMNGLQGPAWAGSELELFFDHVMEQKTGLFPTAPVFILCICTCTTPLKASNLI